MPTEEELREMGMSEEEIAAMIGGDDSGDDQGTDDGGEEPQEGADTDDDGQGSEGDDSADDEEDGDGEGADDEGGDNQEGDGQGADEDGADDGAGDDDGGEQQSAEFDPFKVDMSDAPYVNPQAVKYTDEVRPDIEEKLDALRKEYEEGDKELAEYEKEKRQLEAANMNWQAGNQTWTAEQDAFMDKFDQYSVDGPMRSALMGEVNRLDQATGNKLSGMQLLMAAKESVERALNIFQPASNNDDGGKEETSKGKKPAENGGKRPKAKRPQQQTHAVENSPAAAPQGDGGEFDHLANLKGMDLEAAVAGMSDAQRERWLNS